MDWIISQPFVLIVGRSILVLILPIQHNIVLILCLDCREVKIGLDPVETVALLGLVILF